MTDPISVLIVDDEEPARAQLQRYLENDKRFQMIGEAGNGPQALDKIAELKPDLLLLDIQMPGMTGFDVLRLIEGQHPPVIFITAFDQYAIKAFEVSALDYILKPVAEERFTQALDKMIALGKQDWQSKVEQALDQVATESKYIDRLPVRHLKKVHLLDVGSISHIVSENRLVHVYDNQGRRFWTGETLTQLEARLDPNLFMRIHRSSIINVASELQIEPWEDGRLRVHLGNDTTLVVSRAQANRLKSLLKV